MKKRLLLVAIICPAFVITAQQKSKVNNYSPPVQTDSSYLIQQWIKEAKQLGVKDTAAAEKLFRRAIKEATSTNDNYSAGLAYYEMAEMNSAYGNHNRTFGGYFNARPFFEKAGAEKELAYTFFGLGREQYHRGGFNDAAIKLNYCILLAQKHHLKQLEADALEFLAILYHEITYYEIKSNPYLFQSLHIKQQLNDQKGIVLLLPKISRVYYTQKKYDSALYYANECVRLSTELKLVDAVNSARLDKVNPLIQLQRIADAEAELELLKKSVAVSTSRNFLIRYYAVAGNLSMAANNDLLAKKNYDSALSLAKRNATPENIATVYRNMSDAYAARSDFKNAWYFQREYNDLFVKLYLKDNILQYNESEFLIKSRLSEDKVKYLDAQNQLKQMKLFREAELRRSLESKNLLKDSMLHNERLLGDAMARENIYKGNQLDDEKKLGASLSYANLLQKDKLQNERNMRLALIAALTTVWVLGVVIFFQYRKQKRKNSIIQKQSDELQTLMKEIHHRVKNNLQIISSLLDLQSLSIKDLHASEAVKEGKNRVQSMALIHQNLYNDGNIKGIEVHNYIQNLANNLFDSYNIQKQKIKLVTDIEPLNIDVDTVIPIGLIVNELISNSLKYAFNEKGEGEIKITLKLNMNNLLLQVKDNGDGFAPGRPDNKSSFGY
ncbi:MAG: sensor histidine kinase, partial [Ferruginibacter sp.]